MAQPINFVDWYDDPPAIPLQATPVVEKLKQLKQQHFTVTRNRQTTSKETVVAPA
jgi:hypothetical protein